MNGHLFIADGKRFANPIAAVTVLTRESHPFIQFIGS
jgi:hypothetical protein